MSFKMKLANIPLWALLCVLLSACGESAPPPSLQDGFYVFEHVNVLPMDSERVLTDQRVVVRDARIESVVDAGGPLPAGARVIDGHNRYLLPGLAEMHGHVPGGDDPEYAEDVLFLYISNGVTLVRGMAGDGYHIELRERLARGDLLGPRLYAAGPWLGGHNAGTPEQTRQTVAEHADQGFDLLKVGSLPADNYPVMAAAAREQGIAFGGHIPSGVTLEQALAEGQVSIDHLDRYVEFLVPEDADLSGRQGGFFGSGLIDLVDLTRLPEAVAITRDAGTWNVPTMTLVEHLASDEAPEQMALWPEMRYLPPQVIEHWVTAKHNYQAREDFQPDAAKRLVEVRRKLLKALHDGGAPIVLGSDAPQFFNVPGFSIHHEVAMMVEAGLTPYEVLVTGTRNAAQYFAAPEDFGQVAAGHRADLILLEDNPLDNIDHLRQRAGVMVNGQWLPEDEIQARLDAIAQRHRP